DQLQPDATSGAALGAVAHDQVAIDDQIATGAFSQPRRAVEIVDAAAFLAGVRSTREGGIGRRAEDGEATAVHRDGRALALVEQDLVVGDGAVVGEAGMPHAAAVTGAQVAADPVVVETVAVRAGAEGDATRSG